MPKGIAIPDTVKDNIRKDYYEREMTVAEIVAKYSVSRRAVYDYIKPDRFSAYTTQSKRKMTYLSKKEVELILLMLLECDGTLKGDCKITAKCLENKMLNMADELTI